MTARDWRAGELRFLLVALIVAVAALSSVGFFIDRMRAGLARDAIYLLRPDTYVGLAAGTPSVGALDEYLRANALTLHR